MTRDDEEEWKAQRRELWVELKEKKQEKAEEVGRGHNGCLYFLGLGLGEFRLELFTKCPLQFRHGQSESKGTVRVMIGSDYPSCNTTVVNT